MQTTLHKAIQCFIQCLIYFVIHILSGNLIWIYILHIQVDVSVGAASGNFACTTNFVFKQQKRPMKFPPGIQNLCLLLSPLQF